MKADYDIAVVGGGAAGLMAARSAAITQQRGGRRKMCIRDRKSSLRIGIPVVLGLATNDAMGASGTNIAKLFNTKNVY